MRLLTPRERPLAGSIYYERASGHQPTHGRHAGGAPLPPRGLGLRGEGGRLPAVAYKEGDQVRLISRQGKDFTKRFPELRE